MSRWGGKQDAAAREGHPVPPSQALGVDRRSLGVALGCALVLLLALAPMAFGAPPANDDFADAQVLPAALPIAVSAANFEATKEEGEPYHGSFGSKGHSIWFEWEATSTEFVTVGTCNSDLDAVVSVYTGTGVDVLTKVAGDFDTRGPGCPAFSGNETTFKALGGTTYEIAVDGEAFYVPPGEPPVGEGTIALQVRATPVPANDDFADATVLSGSIEEEEGADEARYWASARGFNWNATKEEGEPDHGGDVGGASVWYRWTAPASGLADVGICEGRPQVLGLYTGESIDALVPVGETPFPCHVTLSATAGATYWIAVDGKFNAESGGPSLGSVGVSIFMRLPIRPKPATPSVDPPPARDTSPPDTTISKRVQKRQPPIWILSFDSTEPGSTFECRLDKRRFAKCGSSKTFRRAKPGRHTLKVRAIDSSGNVDPSPAVARFTAPGKAAKAHATH